MQDGAQGRNRTTDTVIFSFRVGHSRGFWPIPVRRLALGTRCEASAIQV